MRGMLIELVALGAVADSLNHRVLGGAQSVQALVLREGFDMGIHGDLISFTDKLERAPIWGENGNAR